MSQRIRCEYCDKLFNTTSNFQKRYDKHIKECTTIDWDIGTDSRGVPLPIPQAKCEAAGRSSTLPVPTNKVQAQVFTESVCSLIVNKGRIVNTIAPITNHNLENLVDQKAFPELYAAVERGLVEARKNKELWAEHYKAMQEGHEHRADKIFRKIFGIKGPTMDEETKAKLRAYYEEHKEEKKAIAKMSRMIKKRSKK